MTQQNAALVEESAAAATSLREQAARLAEVVSVFNVGRHAMTPSPAPAAMPNKPLAKAPVPRPAAAAPRAAAPKAAPRAGAALPAALAPVAAGSVKSSKGVDSAEGDWETF
jgi:hypothetical protein